MILDFLLNQNQEILQARLARGQEIEDIVHLDQVVDRDLDLISMIDAREKVDLEFAVVAEIKDQKDNFQILKFDLQILFSIKQKNK